MRYVTVDTISFTDLSGTTVAIKDMREIPTYTIRVNIPVSPGDRVDEIASRPDVYGLLGYINAYKILDANLVQLFEGRLDMGRLRTVEVPA